MATLITEAVEVDANAAVTAAKQLLRYCQQGADTERDELLRRIARFVSLTLAAARSFGRLGRSSALEAAMKHDIDREKLYAAYSVAAEIGRKLYQGNGAPEDEIDRLRRALEELLEPRR